MDGRSAFLPRRKPAWTFTRRGFHSFPVDAEDLPSQRHRPPTPPQTHRSASSIDRGYSFPLRPGQILKQPVVHRPLRRGLPATTRIAAMSNHPGLDFHKTCVSPCSLRSPNPFPTSFSSSTPRHGASYVMLPRLQFFAAFGTKLQFSAMPTLFP